jgi:hypothetical protein
MANPNLAVLLQNRHAGQIQSRFLRQVGVRPPGPH